MIFVYEYCNDPIYRHFCIKQPPYLLTWNWALKKKPSHVNHRIPQEKEFVIQYRPGGTSSQEDASLQSMLDAFFEWAKESLIKGSLQSCKHQLVISKDYHGHQGERINHEWRSLIQGTNEPLTTSEGIPSTWQQCISFYQATTILKLSKKLNSNNSKL